MNVEAYEDIPSLLNSVKLSAEKIGTLSSYEKTKILAGEKLMKRAQTYLSQEDYISAYADLYETYLTLKNVEESLSSIFQNSVISIYFITPFISITSSALGAMLFKGISRRIPASVLIYTILIMILYFAYPGYRIICDSNYNPLAKTPLSSSLFLYFY